MTRYLFSRRAHGTWGANLKVSDHPPEVNKRVSSRQRTIRDWRDESGALIIARVFPEQARAAGDSSRAAGTTETRPLPRLKGAVP